jgi:diacylglycerol kinase (ATP)
MTQLNSLSPQEKKIASIINPNAANNKWNRRKFLRKFLQKHLPGRIVDAHEDKAYTVKAAGELSNDHHILVAAGGDGTIADVIQGIVEAGNEKNTSLGIIPLGSGNAFRKSVGIPKNIRKSLRIISEGSTREIDIMDVGGKLATFASIGATAQVSHDKLQNNIPGLFGHILAGKALFTASQSELEVEMTDGVEDSGKHFDHQCLKLKALDCAIMKANHFGYSWKVAPKAKIDDGYVDITFFELSGLKYLLYFPFIYFGLYQRTQRHFKAKELILRGKNLPVQYNGEALGTRDEIRIRVLPKALKIICPSET